MVVFIVLYCMKQIAIGSCNQYLSSENRDLQVETKS